MITSLGLNKNEQRTCVYLFICVIFFFLFDYALSSFFYEINQQTKSLFSTLTHLGDSLYFFIPTIIIWVGAKLLNSKNKIISNQKTFRKQLVKIDYLNINLIINILLQSLNKLKE